MKLISYIQFEQNSVILMKEGERTFTVCFDNSTATFAELDGDDIFDEHEINVEIEEQRKTPGQILGMVGGIKGGKARAKNLSPERRKEIAILGAKARWAKSLPH